MFQRDGASGATPIFEKSRRRREAEFTGTSYFVAVNFLRGLSCKYRARGVPLTLVGLRYRVVSNLGTEADLLVGQLPFERSESNVPEVLIGHLKRMNGPVATRNVHFVGLEPLSA